MTPPPAAADITGPRAFQRHAFSAVDLAGDPEAAFLHARAQAAAGRLQAGRDELRALRQRLPRGSPFLEMHLAAIEESLGDGAAALESLRRATALEPRLAVAQAALTDLHARLGNAQEAREVLARAVEAAPADVVVDTMHWSGGNTSLDAFAAGTPVVTLPGRFMRGRQTAAMLGMMGLPELVATSPRELGALALATARERDRNAVLRARVAAGREALFERSEPIVALQEAFLSAAAARD